MAEDEPKREGPASQGVLVSAIKVIGAGGVIRPATATIGGVAIQEVLAEQDSRLAEQAARLEAIRALAEKPIAAADLEARVAELEKLREGVQTLAEFHHKGGEESGKARARVPWRIAAERVAVVAVRDDPAIWASRLVSKIRDTVDPPVTDRQIWNFIEGLEKDKTIPLLQK
jgi:hypothetical protein